MTRRFTSHDYLGETLAVAERLLGCLLVRQLNGERLSGIIVETEAYLAENDPASHSFAGPKKRNVAMYQAAGTLYVYSIHAKYCLNVVTEAAGTGAAVLIRALQPWEGIEPMQAHRKAVSLRDLSTGPARLCQALAITTEQDQTDLVSSESIWIESAPTALAQKPWRVTRSPRIGISSAQDSPYRFFIDGHACVSGLARLHRTKRSWLFANEPAGDSPGSPELPAGQQP